jgi:hypothetical protein
MLGLFLIEARAQLSPRGHQLTEIVIVLLIFGIVWIWLDANEQALIQEELEESRSFRPRRLYVFPSPDILFLEEHIRQRKQQDGPHCQSPAHFTDWLSEARKENLPDDN